MHTAMLEEMAKCRSYRRERSMALNSRIHSSDILSAAVFRFLGLLDGAPTRSSSGPLPYRQQLEYPAPG